MSNQRLQRVPSPQNVSVLQINTSMVAPELEHLGVDLHNPPLSMRRVELLEAIVGAGVERFQRSVGRDKSSRLGSGFRVQGSGFGVQGSGFRVQGSGLRIQGEG